MTNIYNKGKYRSGEWAKHLRPYLKKKGNKAWRKTGRISSLTDPEAKEILKPGKYHNLAKTIRVKMKIKHYGNFTSTSISRYRTMRAARNAMQRNSVISAEMME